tara:strand:- start:94 stop:711 length:618 start_codon:yes stop_codon:yes gene_type:complete
MTERILPDPIGIYRLESSLPKGHVPFFQASMKSAVVMTIIGPDQPGLMDAISEVIERHNGNWEESRMARLAGEFAGILRLQLDSDEVSGFRESIASLRDQGLQISLAEHPLPSSPPQPGHVIDLELVGQDREGIVHRVTRALASNGINVESFTSHCESAPWTGETLFRAQAKLAIPDGLDIAALRGDLEKIADELMVDFTLNQSI